MTKNEFVAHSILHIFHAVLALGFSRVFTLNSNPFCDLTESVFPILERTKKWVLSVFTMNEFDFLSKAELPPNLQNPKYGFNFTVT